MTRILITGASGFVGSLLPYRLVEEGFQLTIAGRSLPDPAIGRIAKTIAVGEIGPRTQWGAALEECNIVLHMAGRVPGPGVSDEDFHRINNEGTARLAEQAASYGASVFILLSSVFSVVDHSAAEPVDGYSAPAATTPYGLSKLAAEAHVARFAQAGRMGVSLRAPLVYGNKAKGNWQQLQRLAATGLPLPFGGIHNRRSLIAVENLADALVRVASYRRDTDFSGVYAVADDQVVSLAEIIRLLREGMDLPARLISVPPAAISLLLRLAGWQRVASSLLGNLEVDTAVFRKTFEWAPPLDVRQAIKMSAKKFLEDRALFRSS